MTTNCLLEHMLWKCCSIVYFLNCFILYIYYFRQLGCGAGLPGLFCYISGANVTLQDYVSNYCTVVELWESTYTITCDLIWSFTYATVNKIYIQGSCLTFPCLANRASQNLVWLAHCETHWPEMLI